MPLMPVATAAPETAVRQVAQVAVDARVGSHSGLFDYAVPDELIGLIEVGHRVRVPFGKRSVTGFVYALDQAPAVLELKPIEAMVDAEPVLPAVLVELAGFVASHYLVPLDEVIRAIVPPRVRAVVRRTVKRRRQSRILQKANAVTVAAAVRLEPVQLAARERISVAIARQESEVFLLHGVTGSGKTEVYLALLEEVLGLGGATPSVAAYSAAPSGREHLLELPHRAQGRPLPPVTVVDMRKELLAQQFNPLSRELQAAIGGSLARQDQSILFLNRRGLATFVLCRDCGAVRECPHCSVALVYHASLNRLQCHYCGSSEPMPRRCPACGSRYIKSFGIGTERVEHEVRTLFPTARVLRLDRDVMKTADAADLVFDRMVSGEADILVGTQVVAKGLDLPGVTTVGVVNADTGLHFPDYRSSERTFSLLTQVAGRAGRGTGASQVFIQTYTPEHPAIRHARYHDYRGFYREELEVRRAYRFPPFGELIVATYGHRDEARAELEAKTAAEHLRATIALLNLGDIQVLGPSPACVYRLKDEFRFEVTLKGNDLHRAADGLPRGRGWSLDVDPM